MKWSVVLHVAQDPEGLRRWTLTEHDAGDEPFEIREEARHDRFIDAEWQEHWLMLSKMTLPRAAVEALIKTLHKPEPLQLWCDCRQRGQERACGECGSCRRCGKPIQRMT